MKIQIAGPGCMRCQTTEKNVAQAVSELGLNAEISQIYDVREYAKLGVRLTPAVIINGRVATSGVVPTVEKLKTILLNSK